MSDYTASPIVETSTAEERVHDITKERHALELRAEVINLVAGKKAERKGLSDRLEIGIESATDTAYGKEDLHVGGGLTEEAHTAETTGLMLSTTVYGKLNLNYYSDTLITEGGMLEQYTGGEVIAAGMSDNLLGGGGIRIRGADLRMNAASAVEEKVSTLAIDGLVAECCSTACEREEGNAIYSVGFASYKGTMEVLTGTTMRPMCRALFGVRTKNRGGGGSGGDSNEPSPEQSPAAASPESSPKPTNILLPAVGSSSHSVGDLSSTLKRTQSAGQMEDVVTNTDNAIHLKRSRSSASIFDNLKNTDESTTASKALPDHNTVSNQQLGNEVLSPPKDYSDQSYTSRVSGDMSDSPLNQAISDDMAGNNRSLDIEGIDKEAFLKKLSDDQEALKKEYNNTATLDETKGDAIEKEQIILNYVIKEMENGSNPESVFTHAPYDISEEIVNKARDKVSDAIEFSRRSSSQIDNENPYQNIVLTKNNDTTQKRINKSQEELIHVVSDFQSSPDYTPPPRTKTAERPKTVYNKIDYNDEMFEYTPLPRPEAIMVTMPDRVSQPKYNRLKGMGSKLFRRKRKIKNNLDLSANQIDIEDGRNVSSRSSGQEMKITYNLDDSSLVAPKLECEEAKWRNPSNNSFEIDYTPEKHIHENLDVPTNPNHNTDGNITKITQSPPPSASSNFYYTNGNPFDSNRSTSELPDPYQVASDVSAAKNNNWEMGAVTNTQNINEKSTYPLKVLSIEYNYKRNLSVTSESLPQEEIRLIDHSRNQLSSSVMPDVSTQPSQSNTQSAYASYNNHITNQVEPIPPSVPGRSSTDLSGAIYSNYRLYEAIESVNISDIKKTVSEPLQKTEQVNLASSISATRKYNSGGSKPVTSTTTGFKYNVLNFESRKTNKLINIDASDMQTIHVGSVNVKQSTLTSSPPRIPGEHLNVGKQTGQNTLYDLMDIHSTTRRDLSSPYLQSRNNYLHSLNIPQSPLGLQNRKFTNSLPENINNPRFSGNNASGSLNKIQLKQNIPPTPISSRFSNSAPILSPELKSKILNKRMNVELARTTPDKKMIKPKKRLTKDDIVKVSENMYLNGEYIHSKYR